MKKVFARLLFSFFCALPTIMACPEMHGTLRISDQEVVFLKGADAGAAYLTITQTAEASDKLVAVKIKSDLPEKPKDLTSRILGAFSKPEKKSPHVELHDHVPTTENPNALTMKRIKGGVVIPGATKDGSGKLTQGTPVKFEKNGKHLMLYNFPESVRNGDKMELVLSFEKAGDVAVILPINPTPSSTKKPCPHHHH